MEARGREESGKEEENTKKERRGRGRGKRKERKYDERGGDMPREEEETGTHGEQGSK